MKKFFLGLFFLSGFLVLSVSLHAQEGEPLAKTTDGSTVINSDELHFDQGNHIAIFTGNVIVEGNQFRMHSLELTVYFTTANKIDHVVAKGDVLIEQPNRTTKAGQADFYQEDDKIVLTDQPSVLDGKNLVAAPKITIFRAKQTLITEGRTTTTMGAGQGFDASSPPAASTDSSAPALPNNK